MSATDAAARVSLSRACRGDGRRWTLGARAAALAARHRFWMSTPRATPPSAASAPSTTVIHRWLCDTPPWKKKAESANPTNPTATRVVPVSKYDLSRWLAMIPLLMPAPRNAATSPHAHATIPATVTSVFIAAQLDEDRRVTTHRRIP